MSGNTPIDLGAVTEPRDETTTARGSVPQLDQAFRRVEWLLKQGTSP